MAVYKRTYRGYSGPLTASWSRFLVLYRFSRRGLFRSKFQTGFFALCFFFPLLCLLGIYANAHLETLPFLTRKASLFNVNASFFFTFLSTQCVLAFLLTAFVGPGLVSPDLANGALTLYLCRPLSRTEYVAGKMCVLFITLSVITWIPALVVFFVQGSLSGWQWTADNAHLAAASVVGGLLWILILSLLSLALSAWVKWRIAAGALLLAMLFLGAGFAQAVNAVMQTKQGYLLDLMSLISVVWHALFRDGEPVSIPVTEAWAALLMFSAACLFLLMKKIRPNEVIQ